MSTGGLRWILVAVGVLAGLLAFAPGVAGAADTSTITLADQGRTIDLVVGQRFLLALGEGDDWRVTVADQGVVGRVVNVAVVRGAQGLYEARGVGTTTLVAAGEPPCRKSTPPCELPSREFTVTLRVAARSPVPGLPSTGGGYGAGPGADGAGGPVLALLALLASARRAAAESVAYR